MEAKHSICLKKKKITLKLRKKIFQKLQEVLETDQMYRVPDSTNVYRQ